MLPERAVVVTCDRQQIGRALTNLLQNAIDAIEGRSAANDEALPPGEVRLRLEQEGGTVCVAIEDNGRGLPKRERHRLTEPYVTTRERGTGLGLAIVRKIMEDHEGGVRLEDRAEGGARVTLVFGAAGEASKAVDPPDSLEQNKATAHGQ